MGLFLIQFYCSLLLTPLANEIFLYNQTISSLNHFLAYSWYVQSTGRKPAETGNLSLPWCIEFASLKPLTLMPSTHQLKTTPTFPIVMKL